MTDSEPGMLAQRLDHLFRTVHPKGRKPYTLREAAKEINDETGRSVISAAYLSQLRTGEKTNPSHERLAAIARFFGVDVTYFTDDEVAERTDNQLAVINAVRDNGVRRLALRASGLSPETLQALLSMVEQARKIEGLPDDDPTP
ncbi:secretion protein EspR [Sphaerisporangium melleum]|uniref:Secretion protein EspR n=1 Tax=Sphaerisporangium melleum TaxID=321316 RepID=A0A917R1H2_9ACTN|nr:helix-turn-helix transcriptional regulator [Sphaerisporangium melleum]GGK82166.1 secretion protein EspR [Sphaerisporangium melleum]GII71368.1 secretion protein EspR [Sphaerisporangium melleum]